MVKAIALLFACLVLAAIVESNPISNEETPACENCVSDEGQIRPKRHIDVLFQSLGQMVGNIVYGQHLQARFGNGGSHFHQHRFHHGSGYHPQVLDVWDPNNHEVAVHKERQRAQYFQQQKAQYYNSDVTSIGNGHDNTNHVTYNIYNNNYPSAGPQHGHGYRSGYFMMK